MLVFRWVYLCVFVLLQLLRQKIIFLLHDDSIGYQVYEGGVFDRVIASISVAVNIFDSVNCIMTVLFGRPRLSSNLILMKRVICASHTIC